MYSDLISVIVPVYKVEKYLNRCVESIVNQTYKNLEIILVDDGSPDNCPQMCDEWAEKDGRIKVVHQSNAGLAEARNSGMNIMSGSYFLFSDSDDWLDRDMIELLYRLITEHNADMARCGFYFNYEEGGNEENPFGKSNEAVCLDYNEQIKDLAVSGHISGVAWNKLYRSSRLGDIRFYTEDGCSEDIMFNYRVLHRGIKTVYCNDAKYHYFIRDTSITNSVFTDNAFSIIRAKQFIMETQKDNKAVMPYLIKGYIGSCFIVLSGVISSQKCLDKLDYLRNEILKHKNEIFLSSLYSPRDKVKAFVLMLSKKLYCKFIGR